MAFYCEDGFLLAGGRIFYISQRVEGEVACHGALRLCLVNVEDIYALRRCIIVASGHTMPAQYAMTVQTVQKL